jgi:hypothetical protein
MELVENGRTARGKCDILQEMVQAKSLSVSRFIPFLALPALYVFLVTFTMIQSTGVPGGTYYRIFGVNPMAAAVGMVSEGALFFGILIVWGTFWWFYVGWIGRKSWEGSVSRLSSALGAVLSLLSALAGVGLTHSIPGSDDSALQAGAIVQYACVGLLCLSAVGAAIYSTIAVLRQFKSPTHPRHP